MNAADNLVNASKRRLVFFQMAAAAPHIHVSVRDAQNNSVYFKIKATTKLTTLMNVYCARVGRETESLSFLFNGIKLKPDQTANDVGLEDGDIISATESV